MNIRLLGPVQVDRDGVEVVVGPRMTRTLLAILAAEAGRPVQADSLVERLWGNTPPERPRHALHVYVARVRAALGTGAVARRSGGYLLDVPRDAVDVHRFRDLVLAGDLDAALDLPRGVPLEDLTGPWAERTRVAWERWYVDAAVVWAGREITGGDLQRVVGRLGDLCDRHPSAEPLSASLMLALDAAGRRAEALQRFAVVRAWLREELGTEPGAHLRSVHLGLLGPTAVAAADRPGTAGVLPRRSPAAEVAAAGAVSSGHAVNGAGAHSHGSFTTLSSAGRGTG